MSPRDNQFDDWLDGKLDKAQAERFENDMMNDKYMQERLSTAKYVEFLASNTATQKVPNWDRSVGTGLEERRWWQWQGLPVVSMAFSCFAMALVLFNVQLKVGDQGMLISFGESQNNQEQVANLINEKLERFSQQQQLTLANFTADLSEKQQQSDLQLAGYILDTSRQERKEDISDFIQFINAQRKDDVLEQRIRYQQLEDAIHYQSQFINNNATIQPASWVSEE